MEIDVVLVDQYLVRPRRVSLRRTQVDISRKTCSYYENYVWLADNGVWLVTRLGEPWALKVNKAFEKTDIRLPPVYHMEPDEFRRMIASAQVRRVYHGLPEQWPFGEKGRRMPVSWPKKETVR